MSFDNEKDKRIKDGRLFTNVISQESHRLINRGLSSHAGQG